jgi:uncharacterized protein (TIGR02757 family)
LNKNQLYDYLEVKYRQFNDLTFIENDPVSIPHRFTNKADIEISGFLAATLAWGQRAVIIRNTSQLLEWMDNDPSGFIRNFTVSDLKKFHNFRHRTFNGTDCITFLKALQLIFRKFHSLEGAFCSKNFSDAQELNVPISHFRTNFLMIPHEHRTRKHLPDPLKGSASKRLNMFLRWMVRKDAGGVDFGIWKGISPADLLLPLDVHSGRVARSLGLLKRKQDDWKAVLEVTAALKEFDPADPVKYDYALFGAGVTGEL